MGSTIPIKIAGLTKVESTFVKHGESCSRRNRQTCGLYDFRLKMMPPATAEVVAVSGIMSDCDMKFRERRGITV